MLRAIRHGLFGSNREEQETFVTQQIYRLSKWLEQTQQADLAGRAGSPHASPSLADLNAMLASLDDAKARVATGTTLPRAEFDQLRSRISELERAMDAA